ncbi:MAG: DUF6788 family protein [Acidimicrobiales bacterium]
MLRGSLTTFRRRCGKPTCHCATGDRHESPALVYLVDGQSKTMTLRAEEVADVAAAVARYQARRAELEAAAEVGLRLLAERRRARR